MTALEHTFTCEVCQKVITTTTPVEDAIDEYIANGFTTPDAAHVCGTCYPQLMEWARKTGRL